MTPRTLVDIFRNLERTPKPDLLLAKKSGAWTPISTAQFMDIVKAVSCALETLGVGQGGRVALLSENRPEWAMVDFACQCYGAVLVPVFPTMMADQVAYLLKDSGAKLLIVGTELTGGIEKIRDRLTHVEHIITVTPEGANAISRSSTPRKFQRCIRRSLTGRPPCRSAG